MIFYTSDLEHYHPPPGLGARLGGSGRSVQSMAFFMPFTNTKMPFLRHMISLRLGIAPDSASIFSDFEAIKPIVRITI